MFLFILVVLAIVITLLANYVEEKRKFKNRQTGFTNYTYSNNDRSILQDNNETSKKDDLEDLTYELGLDENELDDLLMPEEDWDDLDIDDEDMDDFE